MYCGVSKRLATPPTSIFHCLRLFHSSTPRSLSLMAVYIQSFQVLRERPHFFLLSGLQLIIIFGSFCFCSESFPTDILSHCNYTEQEPVCSKPPKRLKPPTVTDVNQFNTIKAKNKLIYKQ